MSSTQTAARLLALVAVQKPLSAMQVGDEDDLQPRARVGR